LEGIQQDVVAPPIIPGKDIHAHSQASIGFFSEDLRSIAITGEDDAALHSWNFSSASAFNKEAIGVFKEMDVTRRRSQVDAPVNVGPCCAVS